MRKIITSVLFLAAILLAGNMKAQSDLLIDDFEGANKGWATVSCYQDVRANAYKEGINTSSKVLFTNRGTGNDNWSGAILGTDKLSGSPITGYRYLHIKMYRNNTNNPNLKVTDIAGSNQDLLPMSGITIVANQWQDVVFDIGTRPVSYVMFMVDRSAPLAAEAWMLVDDIILSNDPTPISERVTDEPLAIGSMIGKDLPLYPIRDGKVPGTAIAATFDFKVVTIGTTSWAWTDLHGLTIANNSYSSQFRYWSSTSSKTENNLLERVAGTQQTYGKTSTVPPNNPLTITFLQEENNNFYETADFTYDYTKANSANASDTEAPVLTATYSKTDLNFDLTLSATDNSGSYFYYIVDEANGIEDVVFLDGTLQKKLSTETTYDIKVYAVDFSGNTSLPEEIKFTTDAVNYGDIPSEYCYYLMGTKSAEFAYMSMTTDADGKFYMTLVPFNEDNNTAFRNNGYSDDQVQRMTVNGNANTGFKYFTRTLSDDKMQLVFTPVEGMMKPGDQVYINQVIEYKTSKNTDLWPTFSFTYTYGTGCDGVEPPGLTNFVCDGDEILSNINLQLGGVYFAPNWVESPNYTASWADGKLTLHLGAATYGDWQAQFPLNPVNLQPLVAGKAYFISFDIETSADLPRAYMKVHKSGDDNHYIETPALKIPAGKQTVNEIFTNTGGTLITQFDKILFDFGGNPADVDITISNLTICDNYKLSEEEPDGPTEPGMPTHDPSNVISVFCNAYTNIAGINYNPNWGQATQVNPNFAVGNSKLLEYTNLSYQGTEFSDQNVTDMTHLHIEIWSPAAFTPNISLINHDPQIEKPYPLPLEANKWNSFDIPLSAFDMPQYAIWQFKFDTGNGNTMYIANWYFYNENGTDAEAPANFTAEKGTVGKDAVELLLKADDNSGAVFYTISYGDPVKTVTVGGEAGVTRSYKVTGLTDDTNYTFTITVKDRAGNVNSTVLTVSATTLLDGLAKPKEAAPRPTVVAENVISVFSAVYTSPSWFNYGNWGQTTTHSIIQLEGINTLKLEKFNYQGFEFAGAGGALNVGGMDKLHIDVWTPNGTSFKAGLKDMVVACTPLTQGAWNSFDLLLSDFTDANLAEILTMKFEGTAAVAAESTFYIDNIYFFKNPTGINTTADKTVIYTANGKLYVSGSNEAVTVYNVLGKTVYKNTSAENLSVDLAQGVYIVKVGTTATKVLVK